MFSESPPQAAQPHTQSQSSDGQRQLLGRHNIEFSRPESANNAAIRRTAFRLNRLHPGGQLQRQAMITIRVVAWRERAHFSAHASGRLLRRGLQSPAASHRLLQQLATIPTCEHPIPAHFPHATTYERTRSPAFSSSDHLMCSVRSLTHHYLSPV
jgi:hypothetical protein